ncbi:zinc transporter ZupT [Xanthomonas fragariae LMG 25863]|nr:zinc transporter ZupT [Xanthomonas fragariae LMG 25863]
MVVFAKKPNPRLLAFGLAFAGGAMVYVSLSE